MRFSAQRPVPRNAPAGRRPVAGLAAAALLGALIAASAAQAQLTSPFGRDAPRLDREDIAMMREAARPLFETEQEVGTERGWENPATGSKGTVTLAEKLTINGLPCRRLLHDFTTSGRSSRAFRFFVDRCQREDGTWGIMD